MLNLPSPPTDNLYKFISIFGLVVAVLSILYLETKPLEVNQEIRVLDRDRSAFNIEKLKIERKRDYLKEKIDDFNRRADIKEKPVVNDSIIRWTRIISGSKDLITESNNISSLVEQLRTLELELDKKQVEINSKDSILNLKLKDYDRAYDIMNVLIPFGFILSFVGFLLWYDKSQKYQDFILRDQFLQVQRLKICQSCGMDLKLDSRYIATAEEEKKRMSYCNFCYDDDKFRKPDLTYDEMIVEIKNRLKELGANKIETHFYLVRIKNLDRWRKKFTW